MYTPNTNSISSTTPFVKNHNNNNHNNCWTSLKSSVEITTTATFSLHGDLRRNANDERDRRQVDTRLCCYITIVILVDIYIYIFTHITIVILVDIYIYIFTQIDYSI